MEELKWATHYKIEKYREGKLYDVVEFDHNCLLTAGIAELWAIFTGTSSNHFSNSKATIGVGDSTTAAQAGQTDLQASTNKTYTSMETGFPSISNGTITFRASFEISEANYAWEEFVVKQSDSAICLNRKCYSAGTKTAAEQWFMNIAITIS